MAYFRCGGGGMPAGLQSSMDAVLNKKFGTSTTYPASGWPDNVNMLGPLPIIISNKAPIVSFNDGADDVPIEQGTFYVDYDANGYTGMTITKAGKNLIKLSADSASSAQRCSVTYTSSGAEATAEGNYARSGCLFAVKTGVTYTISFTGKSTGDYNRVALNNKDGWTSPFRYVNLTSTEAQYTYTFTATTDVLFFGMYVTGGGTTGVMTISDVQLEVGSTDTAYSAFTSEPLAVSWSDVAGTIYGGNLNITTGVLTSTKAADGTDLAEPVEYQLTQRELRTFYGANNFYCDTGDSQLNYRADISLYINNH